MGEHEIADLQVFVLVPSVPDAFGIERQPGIPPFEIDLLITVVVAGSLSSEQEANAKGIATAAMAGYL